MSVISLALCFVILCIPAGAKEPTVDIMTPDDAITRGASVPKEIWNWDDGTYTGTVGFLGLGNGVLTNYNFMPNADGEINCTIDFSPNTQMGRIYKCQIEIYQTSTKKLIDSSETYTFSDSGICKSFSFTGLDKNKTYYIRVVNRCTTSGQYFTGEIEIYN